MAVPLTNVKCPMHPRKDAVASCSVCGRPTCDLCLGQIDGTDYCPVHFEVAEGRLIKAAYHVPPLPEKPGIAERLVGIWAVLGAVAPWMVWYRTVVVAQGPSASAQVINEQGWDAGGLAALACVALLVTGLTIGVMVGLRLLRPATLSKSSVSGTTVTLGATVAGLLVLQGVVRAAASRSLDAGPGLYVAASSAIVCLYLGRRLHRTKKSEKTSDENRGAM
ncbi:MAG: hypothetical protein ACYDCC_13905 [Actinomycetota bacterium]